VTRGLVLGVAAVTTVTALAACVDDGAVTLPANRNTLKSREIVVDLYAEVPAPADRVHAYNGIQGAPAPLHPELPDLRVAYWRKSGGGDEPDGAHVERVRVSGEAACALTLDGIFAGPSEELPTPSNYRFATLDAQLASVAALNGARATWSPTRAAPPCTVNTALDAGGPRASLVSNVLRHLLGGASWDPAGLTGAVDTVDLPLALVAADGDEEASFAYWAALATSVRNVFPEDGEVPLRVIGPDLTLTDADADALETGEATTIGGFISYVAGHRAPLDQLSYRTVTEHAAGARRISAALRARLDAAGLEDVGLVVNALEPASDAPWDDEDLVAARLGAFETAARVFLQDVPVDAALSGRGPLGFSDGDAHADEPLSELTDLLVPSAYFSADGAPTPAFMARFPLRQIPGQIRLTVVEGQDDRDLAVLASRPEERQGALRVVIADADVDSGTGSVIWQLRVPAFVAPAVRQVDFRIATLDRKNMSLPSFFFSEVGTLEPDARTGDVVLSRELPVPGVHYVEIDRPQLQ